MDEIDEAVGEPLRPIGGTQRSLQSAGTHGAIIGRKGPTVQTFAHPSSVSELIGAETAPSTAAVEANLAVGGADVNGEEHGLAAQLHASKGRVGTGGGSGSSPPGLLAAAHATRLQTLVSASRRRPRHSSLANVAAARD